MTNNNHESDDMTNNNHESDDMTNDQAIKAATKAILTVGKGRGFVVADEWGHYVITAAHCLGILPITIFMLSLRLIPENRTYPGLIGPLGEKPSVDAECVFVDPIADLAVLENSGQAGWEPFDELVAAATALPIAGTPPENGQGYLLSLDGEWFSCGVITNDCFGNAGSTLLIDAGKGIVRGMSGSPILNSRGEAIGVVASGPSEIEGDPQGRLCGPQPRLYYDLPARLVRRAHARLPDTTSRIAA